MEIIFRSRRHPSALDIYDELRKEFPRLSLGNVYRNLGILVEQGKIEALDLGYGLVHYDTVGERHAHFVCRRCCRIYDLPIFQPQKVGQMMQGLTRHLIEDYAIQLHGICVSCKSKRKDRTNIIKGG